MNNNFFYDDWLPVEVIKNKDEIISNLFHILLHQTKPEGFENGNVAYGVDEGLSSTRRIINELIEKYEELKTEENLTYGKSLLDNLLKEENNMSKNIGDTYTCANCGGTFKKEKTDEEAMQESKELFGDFPEEELCIVCEDCFKKIIGYIGCNYDL